MTEFQSTRPSRGETEGRRDLRREVPISIHSPLAGRDEQGGELLAVTDISIHSPLAGRDAAVHGHAQLLRDISIHSPLAGRDQFMFVADCSATDFNPLAPRGARPNGRDEMAAARPISIHSPLAGRDPEDSGHGDGE